MFHPHAEAARVRMFARLGVRLLAVLMSGLFVRDVGAAGVYGYQAGFVLSMLPNAAMQAMPWLIVAGVFLIAERPLLVWLVPVPRAGCVKCGYAMSESQQVCPECGVRPEHEASGHIQAEGRHE